MLRHQPTSTIHSQNVGSQAFTPQAGRWKEASLGNLTKDQKAILLCMVPPTTCIKLPVTSFVAQLYTGAASQGYPALWD